MDTEWPAAGVLLSRRYRLAEKLAASGMSEIWRADDELLGRPVAVKLPRPQVAETLHPAWIEARTTARLSDPHIAAVHDYGEAPRPDGLVAPYVVMELLAGESLAARLTRGPLTWPAAAAIGAQVAAGLVTAHARQVVHRDIKPGNIMLTGAGAKILDFGISAVEGTPDEDETGATFGTPAYVAPERLDGTPAVPATDVYGLGSVLFEMVTGEPPYPVDTWEELATTRTGPPDRLPESLPSAFRDLVEECLADDPRRRPTATQVRDRLTALGPTQRRRRSARARVAAVVVLLVAVGVAVATGPWSRSTGGNDRSGPTVTVTPSVTPTATPSGAGATPAAGLAETVDSLISAVHAGRAAGQIRDDVAVDLINLFRGLDDAPPGDVRRRVAELQDKILVRINEGSLTRTYAEHLRERLHRVARTG